MSAAAIIIPAATAIVIQGIQAWMSMARLAGVTPEEVKKVFDEEFLKFTISKPDKLPE